MVKENYSYPLLPDWSTEEIIIACEFYAEVEKYNTNGVNREKFLEKYQDFLKVAPSKMLQKRLDREYEKLSGYSIYQSVKKVKENEKKFVKGQWNFMRDFQGIDANVKDWLRKAREIILDSFN